MPQQDRPIELAFPDLSPYAQGHGGVPYVIHLDSGKAGAQVMICALTHGNEVCGAIALLALLQSGIKPRRGTLTLSFNNVEAYSRFNHKHPDASRFVDEDFNRLWSPAALSAPADTVERRRAQALRPFIEKTDFLLDIHSMHEPCVPLFVCGSREKNLQLARRIRPDIACVLDAGHAQGVRLRDYGPFDDPTSTRGSVLIECGQHWDAKSPKVALDAAVRFLCATGCSDWDDFSATSVYRVGAAAPALAVTDAVVATHAVFTFAQHFTGLERIQRGELIGYDGGREVRAPYDDCVLIMPSLRHAKPGVTVVRLAHAV
jgi:predicted deacylase